MIQVAIITGQFGMFVMGSVLLGVAHGVAQFYRYAAADGLPDQEKPKAVSFVLLGGLAAAIGPEIAYRFVDVVEGARYAGAFIAAGVLHLLGFILAGMDSPKPPRSALAGRDMSVFALPGSAGLAAAALGYAVMSFDDRYPVTDCRSASWVWQRMPA